MIKAFVKIILLVAWIILSVALLWIISKTKKKKWCEKFANFGFTVVCLIIGLKVKVVGEMAKERPLLLVSNHVSYLDIMVLGSKTPASFTPKGDMEKWPVIASACRLLGSVFIDRSIGKTQEMKEKLRDVLAKNSVISLFPEGTTGDGRHVLPFKSSLFSIAEEKFSDEELLIQPAVISYKSVGALPIDSTKWPLIAWYGDMNLLPHLWKLLQLGRIDAVFTFLPVVKLSQFADRKQLATHLREEIIETLQGNKQ